MDFLASGSFGFGPIKENGVFSLPRPKRIMFVSRKFLNEVLIGFHRSHDTSNDIENRNLIQIRWGKGVVNFDKRATAFPNPPQKTKHKSRTFDTITQFDDKANHAWIILHPENSDIQIDFTGSKDDVAYFYDLMDRSEFTSNI